MDTKTIVDSLAMPIFYVPIYKTPEDKYFLDADQILSSSKDSVKARKFDTFVAVAQLQTKVTELSHCIHQQTDD